jgi:uncharacterized protein
MTSAFVGLDLKADPQERVGKLHIHAQRSGADILVHGSVQTRFVAVCSRCLGDAAIDVDTQIATLMSSSEGAHAVPGVEPLDEEIELQEDEPDREYFTGEDIILDGIVREHILLECPIKPLCHEDCTGIEVPAHVRGPERLDGPVDDSGNPIDPRLAPLLKVARKLGQNEE